MKTKSKMSFLQNNLFKNVKEDRVLNSFAGYREIP